MSGKGDGRSSGDASDEDDSGSSSSGSSRDSDSDSEPELDAEQAAQLAGLGAASTSGLNNSLMSMYSRRAEAAGTSTPGYAVFLQSLCAFYCRPTWHSSGTNGVQLAQGCAAERDGGAAPNSQALLLWFHIPVPGTCTAHFLV